MQVVFTNEVTHEQSVATVVAGPEGHAVENLETRVTVRPAVMPVVNPTVKKEHTKIVSCFEGVEDYYFHDFPKDREEQIEKLTDFLDKKGTVIEENIDVSQPMGLVSKDFCSYEYVVLIYDDGSKGVTLAFSIHHQS